MFFDFHIHPSMKCLFSDPPEKFGPWENLDTSAIPDLLNWCTEFKYILRSQANLNQLWYNDCRLVCVALYAPEKGILDNPLILGQATGKLGKYIHEKKIKKIINGTLKPYDLVVNDDLKVLLDPTQFGITNKKVVPLWDKADYDESKTDTIYVVFSVEGCHSLSSSLMRLNINEIISSIDDLATRVPLLAINLTHMEQYGLSNHAYGMQFINNKEFRPTGFGLSSNGAKIVQHCYNKNICIDLKHMSLGARTQLYNLRWSPGFQAINQPLLCTHAGFTGISTTEIPAYFYKTRKYTKDGYRKVWMGKPFTATSSGIEPAFNPSSINLYDEDIQAILESGGMIGLSLDKRILGYDNPDGVQDDSIYAIENEYISIKEEAFFFTGPAGTAFDNGKCMLLKTVREGGTVDPNLAEYHLRHFMAHLVHLIRVARHGNYDVNKALKQVCIGSDYDGMINPLSSCEKVDELVYFKELFEKRFVAFAGDCNVALPQGFDVMAFSEALFYKNGKEFVMNRLDLI